MSLFKEDYIFSTKTNLTYGPLKSKTYINIVIYIYTKYDVWNTYQNMYNHCSLMRHRIKMKIQLKDTQIYL